MKAKLLTVILFVFVVLALISACSSKQPSQQLLSINEVKQSIEAENVLITSIDIPNELKSNAAEVQEGYLIEGSGDKLFIYQYKDHQTLSEDKHKIHNQLNEFTTLNPLIQMTKSNMYMIYVKMDKDAYDIENKILKVF